MMNADVYFIRCVPILRWMLADGGLPPTIQKERRALQQTSLRAYVPVDDRRIVPHGCFQLSKYLDVRC